MGTVSPPDFDCASTVIGACLVVCEVDPEAGPWWALVSAFSGIGDYQLTVSIFSEPPCPSHYREPQTGQARRSVM